MNKKSKKEQFIGELMKNSNLTYAQSLELFESLGTEMDSPINTAKKILSDLDVVSKKAYNKHIKLPLYGIEVFLLSNDEGEYVSGSIQSELSKEIDDNSEDDIQGTDLDIYNNSIDVVESLILAHAMAGVDIASLSYVEGLEVTIEKIFNEF